MALTALLSALLIAALIVAPISGLGLLAAALGIGRSSGWRRRWSIWLPSIFGASLAGWGDSRLLSCSSADVIRNREPERLRKGGGRANTSAETASARGCSTATGALLTGLESVGTRWLGLGLWIPARDYGQVSVSLSMDEVTVPSGFTVMWKIACSVSRDPSEPWRTMLPVKVAVKVLEFTFSPSQNVAWPL
jgi:hypothetical protein